MLLLSALLATIATVHATAPSSTPGVGGDAAPMSSSLSGPPVTADPVGNETTPKVPEKPSNCGDIPPRNASAAALDPCGLEMNVKAPEKFEIYFYWYHPMRLRFVAELYLFHLIDVGIPAKCLA